MEVDWSIVIGLGLGLGGPAATGLALLIRMEHRVTTLEQSSERDRDWRERLETKVDSIARDVNRLIGARQAEQR